MKKLLGLMLIGMFSFVLVGCGSSGNPIDRSELIGRWENGSGSSLFAQPIGNTMGNSAAVDIIEFLDDGTLILNSNSGQTERTSIWQLNNNETLLVAEGNEFVIEIDGNILTITDSDDRQRQWLRSN